MFHFKLLCFNVFIWYPLQNLSIIIDRPQYINKDEQGRLHDGDKPALHFRDGWALWYWHGINVPKDIILHPDDITLEKALNEPNQELRRILFERMDKNLLLTESHILHQDATGTLFEYRNLTLEEPVVFVGVKNSSPEEDGSFKDYYLRVPPNTTSAQEGIAWTFGLTAEEYHPYIET